jgi:hypothetical protein
MEEFGCGPDREDEMLTRIGSRVKELGLVLCATGTMYACAPASHTTDDRPAAYPLQVDNRTDFEVVIYSMRSGSTRGQRLGTARPFGKTVLSIPTDALMGQELFAVQLHAIGAPRTVPNWLSYGIVVRDDLVAQLDIFGDGSGNLRMSTLTTRMPRTYK